MNRGGGDRSERVRVGPEKLALALALWLGSKVTETCASLFVVGLSEASFERTTMVRIEMNV